MSDENKIALSESIKSLFVGSQLEESQQEQFAEIFEAAVKLQSDALIAEQVGVLEVELQETKDKAQEYGDTIRTELSESANEYGQFMRETAIEELTESLDKYMDLLRDEFMAENKIAIESGMKVEMFDSIMSDLVETFKAHNVEIPEEKVDLVADLEESIVEKDQKITALLESKIAMRTELQELKKAKVIEESTTDLTVSQRERVAKLAENLRFDDAFASKLKMVRESVGVPSESIIEAKEVETGVKVVEVEAPKLTEATGNKAMADVLAALRTHTA